jgi:hypothetical protein
VLTFTDRAREALTTFHGAAARWNPDVRLRLVRVGAELRPELVDEALAEDVEQEIGPITVLVPRGVEGVVDAGEHNVLTFARS